MTINKRFLSDKGLETLDLLLPGLFGLFGKYVKRTPKGAEIDFEATSDGGLNFSYWNGKSQIRFSETCLTGAEIERDALRKDKSLFVTRYMKALDRWIGEK